MKELLFYNARIDNQGLAICVSNKDILCFKQPECVNQ